jgi:hypothetical protein
MKDSTETSTNRRVDLRLKSHIEAEYFQLTTWVLGKTYQKMNLMKRSKSILTKRQSKSKQHQIKFKMSVFQECLRHSKSHFLLPTWHLRVFKLYQKKACLGIWPERHQNLQPQSKSAKLQPNSKSSRPQPGSTTCSIRKKCKTCSSRLPHKSYQISQVVSKSSKTSVCDISTSW